jgi:hypothetical protein
MIFLTSDLVAILRKLLEHKNRGSWKHRCIVSNWDLTSWIAAKLKNLAAADFNPFSSSIAFSMHLANECSMTESKLPCPDFVMYFVMYSITPNLVVVACQSMFEFVANIITGT